MMQKAKKPRGRPFVKGGIGNPKGRAKETQELRDVKALAKIYTLEAIDKLVELMRTNDHNVALKAANAILNRGWGQPSQAVEVTGQVTLEQLVVGSLRLDDPKVIEHVPVTH